MMYSFLFILQTPMKLVVPPFCGSSSLQCCSGDQKEMSLFSSSPLTKVCAEMLGIPWLSSPSTAGPDYDNLLGYLRTTLKCRVSCCWVDRSRAKSLLAASRPRCCICLTCLNLLGRLLMIHFWSRFERDTPECFFSEGLGRPGQKFGNAPPPPSLGLPPLLAQCGGILLPPSLSLSLSFI